MVQAVAHDVPGSISREYVTNYSSWLRQQDNKQSAIVVCKTDS